MTPDESMHVLLERLAGEMREGFARVEGSVATAMAKHETELVQMRKELDDGLAKHDTDHAEHERDIEALRERTAHMVTWKAFWLGIGAAIAGTASLKPILDIIINK